MHRMSLIKGWTSVNCICIYNTNTMNRHANLIGNVQSFSKGILQYVQMLQIFTNKLVPAFTTLYFWRIVKKGWHTLLKVKNILQRMCAYVDMICSLEMAFSGRTIHAHNVWCPCHSLATNATCSLFVTAQDKNSVNNLLFFLTYHKH